MSNLYTMTADKVDHQFVVAQSTHVDEADVAIVVACLPGEPGQAVMDEAVRESVYRGSPEKPAALHVLTYRFDQEAGPGHGERADADAIGGQLAESGIEYRVYRSSGEPLEQLLQLVAVTNAELVAISVRRRSPVMKLFLGSVAQRLILEAPCPVLAVK